MSENSKSAEIDEYYQETSEVSDYNISPADFYSGRNESTHENINPNQNNSISLEVQR